MIKSIFRTFGNPVDVTELEELHPRSLEEGEVRIRMLASPINPADINLIQGTYGVRPELPCTPGIEGCGVIIESRDTSFHVKEHVIFIARSNTWSEEIICPASSLLIVPSETPVEQAAMLKVNPLTAWAMLTHYLQLPKGSWVIQNAANSGVGLCVIQIAKLLGLRTINLVRREELIPELLKLGGDIVMLDNAESITHIKETLKTAPPTLALNAVGGDSALRLMDALAPKGIHVTYGAMSMRSLKVPNKFLIFKGIQLHGFWCTEWMKEKSTTEIKNVFQQLAKWMIRDNLHQTVDSRFHLKDVKQAITRAQENKRNGKVLITMGKPLN